MFFNKLGNSFITEKLHSSLNDIKEISKLCTLHWLPVHVNLTSNDSDDKWTKQTRHLNNDNFNFVKISEAKAVSQYRLNKQSIPLNHQLFRGNVKNYIPKIFVSLLTDHYKGITVDKDRRKTNIKCNNCLKIELMPESRLTGHHSSFA